MAATRYLLDTGILLALVKKGPLGIQVDQTYNITAQPFAPMVSIVSFGEIMVLAQRGQLSFDSVHERTIRGAAARLN